jgi:hypothetical protein
MAVRQARGAGELEDEYVHYELATVVIRVQLQWAELNAVIDKV